MKIGRGDQFHDIVIDFEDVDSDQLKFIMENIIPKVLNKFAVKNRGYTQPEDGQNYSLGSCGEFVEIHRKVGKLHVGLWDDKKYVFDRESKEEVVMDVIGHCLLMLEAFKKETGLEVR